MDLKQQQKRFDNVKWFDSIQVGDDRCGTYELCEVCRKDQEYPCARAARRYRNGYVRVATIHRHA